jgi:GNAT superfamily N-acetyltransferase
MLPEGWFVALDHDQLVGTSRAFRNLAKNDQLDGSLTGVIRSYRRRGIATALKLRLIQFAKEYGAAVMLTANEENNPIYTLNRALGFTPQPAWIEFEKTMRVETSGT